MVSTNKKGIWLCRTQVQNGKDAAWLLDLSAAVAGSWTMALLAKTLVGIPGPELFGVMGTAGTVVCFGYTVLHRMRQEKWFYPGVLALGLLAALIGRPWLMEGVRRLFNCFSLACTAGTGIAGMLLSGAADAPDAVSSIAAASAVLGCGAGCLCSSKVRSRGWLIAGILSAWLSGILLLRNSADLWCLVLVPMVSVLLIVNGSENPEAGSIIWRWCLCCVCALFLMAVMFFPAVQRRCEAFRDAAREAIHHWKYETEVHPLPEGDLRAFQIPEEAEQILLTVTLEEPQALYLRGFVGCTFAEDLWEDISNSVLADNRELLYWLNRQEFHPAAQFGAAAALQGRQHSLVTVQNHLACSRYLYVPYGLYGESCSGYLPAENLHSDSVFADGQRTYAYSVISGGTEDISDILTRLQSGTDENLLAFRRAESAYREYVSNHYLQIPQEMRDLLQAEWDRCAAGYGAVNALTGQQAQECALYFLEQYFPEEPPEEERQMPLAHLAGSTYQYATVAAMTLRYYGVPARYAEGFMITQEIAAAAGTNGTVNVTQSNAGAWVEVYQDGIGWLPMDLTPGMGQTIEERPYSSVKTDDAEKKQGTKTEEEEKEEETDRPDGGSLVTIRRIFDWAQLLLPILLVIAVLAVILRRRYLLRCRERRFQADSCRDAVGWIFCDAVQLLEQLGFEQGNGSLNVLLSGISQCFGVEYAEKLKEMKELNGRAVFSTRELEEGHREEMRAFYESTLQHLKKELPWWKKIWLMWGLCLY